MKDIEEIERLYDIKLNYLENYEHIIIDIFKNDNLNYDLNNSNILWIIGLYYESKIKNYDEMKKYYLMAIELKNDKAMIDLGYYYYYIEKNYDEMKKYYLMAIELNNIGAMVILGYYSYYEKNYDEMKKCYLMAIKFNNCNAMSNLGYYYQRIEKNYDEMKKYYLMAIELKDDGAMFNLANYYQFIEKNYDEMKKYYLMAIELNNNFAMNRLLSAFDVSSKFCPLVCKNKDVVQHYLLRQINSKIAIEKVKELEGNNFLGVKIFEGLAKYCFNPQRLLKLCNIYNIEFDNYIDMI